MTEAELILQKALVGSNLDSSQWNQIQAGFRNRAFFSSRVAQVNILAAMRDKVAEYARGETDISKIRMKIREDLQRLHYTPKPGEQDTIHDLFSQARLDVIIKTNVAQARGYMQYAEGMSPGAFAAFPAQEFTRIRHSRKPRQDWPQRWAKAGGKTYGGKMIALKDDPVWERLSVFGNPFPPFDWGSGMGVLDVDRKTAIQLGLISDDELRGKTAALRGKPVPGFNRDMQASVEGSAADLEKLQRHFGAEFGDLVRLDGNVLKWRAEVLKETVLHGKDFSVSLGTPRAGMLKKLLDNPTTNAFAYKIAGKELTVDQTWRDTKRSKGGTHIRHFIPTAGDMRKYPEDIPLTAEDMEMLPCLWRNPDRVVKLGGDKFQAELDAFDGSTYVLQIKLELTGPRVWTFLRTKNPASKKIAAGAVKSHLGPVPSKKGPLPVTQTP